MLHYCTSSGRNGDMFVITTITNLLALNRWCLGPVRSSNPHHLKNGGQESVALTGGPRRPGSNVTEAVIGCGQARSFSVRIDAAPE